MSIPACLSSVFGYAKSRIKTIGALGPFAAAVDRREALLFRELFRLPPLPLEREPAVSAEAEDVEISTGEPRMPDAKEAALETGRDRTLGGLPKLRDWWREGVGEGGAGREELMDMPETRECLAEGVVRGEDVVAVVLAELGEDV